VTITSYPFENGDTSESQFSRLFVELQDSGVCGSQGSTTFKVTANGADLNLSVAPGFAIVRGHAVDSTATETLALAAAESNPRIDRVVLRLDPIANSIILAVIKGTAASSPTAPALTQTVTGTYEMPLATVRVDAAVLAIAAEKVTDERPYVGSRVGVWTTVTRPASPRKGQMGFNVSSATFEFYNGTGWAAIIDGSQFLAATGKAVDSDKLDGIDSPTFARRDQANNFAGTVNVTSGVLQEGGQRVYSPNNPPPENGMKVLGAGAVTGSVSGGGAGTWSDAASTSFVAPPSGRVMVHMDTNAVGSYTDYVGVRLSNGSYDTNRAKVAAIDTTAHYQGAWGFTGLTPGATYTAYVGIRSNNASNGSVQDPSLYVMG
jgi:hypothetical protein